MHEPPPYLRERLYKPALVVMSLLSLLTVLSVGSYSEWNGLVMLFAGAVGIVLMAIPNSLSAIAKQDRAADYKERADQARADAGILNLDLTKCYLLPETGPLPPTKEGYAIYIAYHGQAAK